MGSAASTEAASAELAGASILHRTHCALV